MQANHSQIKYFLLMGQEYRFKISKGRTRRPLKEAKTIRFCYYSITGVTGSGVGVEHGGFGWQDCLGLQDGFGLQLFLQVPPLTLLISTLDKSRMLITPSKQLKIESTCLSQGQS